jgi:histidinol dehydrogenase
MNQIRKIVRPILKRVQKRGDRALVDYAQKFDGAVIDEIIVQDELIQFSDKLVSPALKDAIDIAYRNIEAFHKAQTTEPIEVETSPGVVCKRKSIPISRVGLYIPGGTAPLFSTVLMLGIPAKIAGCKRIVLCTPPNSSGEIHPSILYAAKRTGIHKIIRAGGAQAIAAMAYGTESVPRVYKIFGPGNQYVAAAKQVVSMEGIAIDLPAGPSELAVFADQTSNPAFVASDLLSQAEHGPDSQVLLLSDSKQMVKLIIKELDSQLALLPRKEIARASLKNSTAIITDSKAEAIALINDYAPEHLILAIDEYETVSPFIENAGSIFLGHYSPESAGDYASGTNHTLPTDRAALAYGGVSVDSFVKKITYQYISRTGLKNLGPAIEIMADAEGLQAHKNAVTLRLNALS